MSEWIAAGAGLVGALVGGGFSIWGARLNSKTVLAQLAGQRADNNDQWIRNQRREAYTALLAAVDRSLALEEEVNVRVVVDGELTESVADQVIAVVNETRAAATRVDICGPDMVRAAADELRDAALQAVTAMTKSHVAETAITDSIQAAIGRRQEAHDAFRQAASKALGFE